MDTNEYRIQLRAYAIWLEEGCPDGRSQDHWEQAQRETEEFSEEEPTVLPDSPEELMDSAPTPLRKQRQA